MSKKYFFSVVLFLFYSTITKGESIASFIKKHNLPENINVLSVFGEDCVNCYYGFSYFLKEHTADFEKENFVFLFQKSAENEIENIFKYRLGIEKSGYKIIVDDSFYNFVTIRGVSTLSIVENNKIKEQFTAKDINKFSSFAKTKTPAFNIVEKDTINLKKIFGTKKISVAMLNESNILIHNKYTNDLSVFNITQKTTTKTFLLSTFTGMYDSILKLLLINDPTSLTYNLNNYKTNDFYKTFPLCSIKKASCINNEIYVDLFVSKMVPDSSHINYETLFAIVKLDSNLQLKHIYKVPDTISGSDKHLNFFDCIFVAPEKAVVSLSVMDQSGLRKKDSVCALYNMSTNEIKILNLGYEPFMPLKGNNGYYNYYHFDVWHENNILKGYFNRSPYIYNLSDNTKSLIPDIGVDIKTIDIIGKDKFFWISKIYQYQNATFVIANQKQNETSFMQYDIDIKTLVSKKKLFDGYLSDVFILQNKLFAFENYSEKGDVAMLHIYQIK